MRLYAMPADALERGQLKHREILSHVFRGDMDAVVEATRHHLTDTLAVMESRLADLTS